ncbi:hypothetical protein F3Y22_tig00004035pilonHSYRG00112 [Hibiscus syriacus]|uniref:Uncharacterized protein n=1 Tax=Hibiscus syriacus TaxID=106335 RepID=A0A6A3CNQ2_HIBSY|nr:hypothetical protein F3Y22_tig00004035pilonHSYRG00112 [Hibiscus syriacus]
MGRWNESPVAIAVTSAVMALGLFQSQPQHQGPARPSSSPPIPSLYITLTTLPRCLLPIRRPGTFSAWSPLLLGVGCGALTAATIYLVWMIFTGRREYLEDYESDEEFSSKKNGYVNIPPNPAVNVKEEALCKKVA